MTKEMFYLKLQIKFLQKCKAKMMQKIDARKLMQNTDVRKLMQESDAKYWCKKTDAERGNKNDAEVEKVL